MEYFHLFTNKLHTALWKQMVHPFRQVSQGIRVSENWVLKCKVKSLSHVWLCDPMDCSMPGSSIHGSFPGKKLEWVAISFSRGSSGPRDQTWVSRTAGRLSTTCKSKTKKQQKSLYHTKTKPPTYLCHVKQRTDIKIRDNAQRQRVFYAWFQQQWEIWHNSVPAFKTQEQKTPCLPTRCRARRQFWVATGEAFSLLLCVTLLLFLVNYYLEYITV